MTPTHAVKNGRRYRYYVSTPLITGTRSDHAKGWRIPAGDIEQLVLGRLRAFFACERDVSEAVSGLDLDASAVRSAMANARQLAEGWTSLPPVKLRELVQTPVETTTVHAEGIVVSLKRPAVATLLLGDRCCFPIDRPLDAIDLRIEAKLRRAGKGIRLVIGGGRCRKARRVSGDMENCPHVDTRNCPLLV